MTKPSSPYSHSRHSLINGHGPLLAACQCTILAHFRHLTEIGSPPRMVRWPLWSPSAVCQCVRRFARLFRFRKPEDLLCVLLVCRFHLIGLVSFSASLFPCKGRATRYNVKNRRLFWDKFCAEPSTDCSNLGIPQNFSQNFLAYAPWRSLLITQQEKGLKTQLSR